MNIEKKLIIIFLKFFKRRKEVKSIKRLNEEKWDSLIHVNIMIAIESEFGIRFSSGQIESLNSFKSKLSIIKKNLNEKKN